MEPNPFEGGKKDMFASALQIPGVTTQKSKEEMMKELEAEEQAWLAQPLDMTNFNKEVFDPKKYENTPLFYDSLEGKQNESAVMALQVQFFFNIYPFLTFCQKN